MLYAYIAQNIYLRASKVMKCSSKNLTSTIISDAEISVQIEEEEELSPISSPVKDDPIVSKSEPNEEWIPMEEMKQFEVTGKTESV